MGRKAKEHSFKEYSSSSSSLQYSFEGFPAVAFSMTLPFDSASLVLVESYLLAVKVIPDSFKSDPTYLQLLALFGHHL